MFIWLWYLWSLENEFHFDSSTATIDLVTDLVRVCLSTIFGSSYKPFYWKTHPIFFIHFFFKVDGPISRLLTIRFLNWQMKSSVNVQLKITRVYLPTFSGVNLGWRSWVTTRDIDFDDSGMLVTLWWWHWPWQFEDIGGWLFPLS